jgi:ankyrin repeat protein
LAQQAVDTVLAAQSQNLEAVEVLLDHGAEINGTGEYGMTALTTAINCENIELIKLLLSRMQILE